MKLNQEYEISINNSQMERYFRFDNNIHIVYDFTVFRLNIHLTRQKVKIFSFIFRVQMFCWQCYNFCFLYSCEVSCETCV